MSTDLEYTLPNEELPVVWQSWFASSAGYSVDKLSNNNPADPFKLEGTYIALAGTLPAPAPVACVAIIHHNLDAGKHDVYLAGGTAAGAVQTWVFPIVPPKQTDGFPVNLLLDLRPFGPLPIWTNWWIMSYPGWGNHIPNSVPVSIGELKLYSNIHAIDGSLVVDLQPAEQEGYPIIDHVTEGDLSMIYPYGTKHRYLRGGILQAGDAAAEMQRWFRSARGRSLPFLVLVSEYEGVEVPEPWLCRFEKSTLDRKFDYGSVASTFELDLEEVSRGLIPTPASTR